MNNQFSENLKKVRKDNNLSQEQLADELGVSRQAISKWESSTAYPEMDKIIALCDKFDLNIDDLLHKDIKEIKGEEESKKKLNKSIDDFLKFITDIINLFSNMNFKSKIKCLIEQSIIILILIIISAIIVEAGYTICFNLVGFLPNNIRYIINNFLNSILILFCIISSIIILTHIFKTRYLDYYDKLKKTIINENDYDNEKSDDKQKNIDKKNKILFRKNESKIIIRDPKHSEYRFVNSLFKFIIGIIKFFALCLVFFISFILITLFLSLIISLLIYKTGIFFIGLMLSIIALIIMLTIILLVILNFIFTRKNEKKKLIWSFILSLAILGSGLGLIFIGTLNFEILDYDNTMLKKEEIEFEMQDNIFINNNVEYVESDINNIKLEYKINKFCKLEKYNHDNIHLWAECSNPIKQTNEFIKNINNKKIIFNNNSLQDIVVYASKENINKLKNNKKNYFNN